MGERKSLKVDLGEVCSAMEDSSWEHAYYLDVKTGEILFLLENGNDEETEKLRGRFEGEVDRYQRIPRVESHKGYEDMQDFIATLKDEHLAGLLEVAITGKGGLSPV